MIDKIPVALLTISIDPDLAKPAVLSPGDAYDRQLKYAGILAEYYAITYIKQASADSAPIQVTDNFTVYPLHAQNLLWFVRAAVDFGSHLCRTKKIDAISTQDPFFTALIGYRLKKKFGLPLSIQSVAD
ncbi:MAG TPA: hypothetical protein VFF70_14410, partial [Anaerolineae bacterium]|nr:hypothetical protein [Anaerolineae bacterium]